MFNDSFYDQMRGALGLEQPTGKPQAAALGRANTVTPGEQTTILERTAEDGFGSEDDFIEELGQAPNKSVLQNHKNHQYMKPNTNQTMDLSTDFSPGFRSIAPGVKVEEAEKMDK